MPSLSPRVCAFFLVSSYLGILLVEGTTVPAPAKPLPTLEDLEASFAKLHQHVEDRKKGKEPTGKEAFCSGPGQLKEEAWRNSDWSLWSKKHELEEHIKGI